MFPPNTYEFPIDVPHSGAFKFLQAAARQHDLKIFACDSFSTYNGVETRMLAPDDSEWGQISFEVRHRDGTRSKRRLGYLMGQFPSELAAKAKWEELVTAGIAKPLEKETT